jgi:hypothetical protein
MQLRALLCRAFSPLNLQRAETQGYALGWDVAAPLALSEGNDKSRSRFPCMFRFEA